MRGQCHRTRLAALTICCSKAAAAVGLLLCQPAVLGQTPTSTGGSPAQNSSSSHDAGSTRKGDSSAGTSIMVKRMLSGDFTYRFITDKDQTSAPAPLAAPSSPDGATPLLLPASIPAKSAVLEVVNKTTGDVARTPLIAGTAITLTQASFKYVQTVFVTVQHDSKPVTDVLVTIADATHKYSMAWQLKKADNGIAQFANVPLGEPITVGVNGAGHPVMSQTSTIMPGHPSDGYHWPTISVDWSDVATITPPVTSPPVSAQPSTPGTYDEDRRQSSTPDRKPEQSGGAFSSVINSLAALAVVALVIYGAVWAFNKGHVKTLLDRAGINTSELTGGPTQPSPFDKPARAPIVPITEGTADPFGGSGYSPVAAPVVAAGPRLVSTAGAYSGSIFSLSGAFADIGRDAGNGVALPNDTNSSRRHATINMNGSDFSVTDNGSSNGTFLNGVRIPPNTPQPLRPGDELQVGMTRFRFEIS